MRHLNSTLVVLMILFVRGLPAQDSIEKMITRDSLSTDYPHLYRVTLSSDVTYALAQGFYYYKYTLISDGSNKGEIWFFNIDILRRPGSAQYDTAGLEFATSFERNEFRRYYPPAASIIESVGFPSFPNLNWSAAIVHSSVASFDVDTLLPKPGAIVGGFSIMSKALPGMRAFTAYPYFDVYKFYPDVEGDTTPALDAIYSSINAYVDSMKNAVNYHGWTVGPTAPPFHLSALTWIDTLTSYKSQSLKLGWLIDDKSRKHDCDDIMRDKEWYKKSDFWKHGEWDNDETWDFDHDWDIGLVKVLDRRLEKARQLLLQNDSIRARKELETFVMEVELINDMSEKMEKRNQSDRESLREGPLSGKPVMTSEAYALLQYNAEYLIDRLPDRHGRVNKGDDRRR